MLKARVALVFRLFHTVRYMLPVQWIYLVYYRILRRRIPHVQLAQDIACRRVTLTPPLQVSRSRVAGMHFIALNEVSGWDWDNVDWCSAEHSKLWRYNLHYFDWLREPEPREGLWRELMLAWVRNVPYGIGDGWEPYPLSLRIVNWIKWLWQHPEQQTPELLTSLFQQGMALEMQIEYHIQANHLYKNAVALVFLGCFFANEKSAHWLSLGKALWTWETLRQFLPDGGHFERSPLYHSLCLEDALDVINVLHSAGQEIPPLQLTQRVAEAVRWMQVMLDPEGNIALLNDSAYGIAGDATAIASYFDRLGLSRPVVVASETEFLAATGYFVHRHKRFHLIFDCSDIGPAFQPGHTHCDMLSFLLWYDGVPVFIDGGVNSYLDNSARRYARSTAAHNTVKIEDWEQSDIWSAFRVGERARITAAECRVEEGALILRGAHDGYQRFWPGAVHERTLSLKGQTLRVLDRIEGASDRAHLVTLFFHVSDYHRVVMEDGYCALLHDEGHCFARIILPAGLTAMLVERAHFTEFGLTQSHWALELSGMLTFPCAVETEIVFN